MRPSSCLDASLLQIAGGVWVLLARFDYGTAAGFYAYRMTSALVIWFVFY
ncbi:hypothetical protein GLOTRDRAFT_131054 [Gloeophyllum trabeum ATCC 11539]|uniref:Uncharacterized protein n=1 Tax=Gloeophyllum trabeum (strain ATCC 11539 / FP-39264 / Madison 617) TaxID=670483 RepID=S7Q2D5_GLOTA|nr:uncharacterized protein GLOTRDRAFT_131054 [Gloeophyllum trabeum ATCC 11539]EPQ53717.1 hypothetical protein GLOTRDRAFT_131054 [Gloeophyllum trabeum ATCC 11539]